MHVHGAGDRLRNLLESAAPGPRRTRRGERLGPVNEVGIDFPQLGLAESAPGRWLLINTSALASKSTKRCLPSGLLMSVRMDFLPQLTLSQIGVTQSPWGE
jgi:hypothetical protein